MCYSHFLPRVLHATRQVTLQPVARALVLRRTADEAVARGHRVVGGAVVRRVSDATSRHRPDDDARRASLRAEETTVDCQHNNGTAVRLVETRNLGRRQRRKISSERKLDSPLTRTHATCLPCLKRNVLTRTQHKRPTRRSNASSRTKGKHAVICTTCRSAILTRKTPARTCRLRPTTPLRPRHLQTICLRHVKQLALRLAAQQTRHVGPRNRRTKDRDIKCCVARRILIAIQT